MSGGVLLRYCCGYRKRHRSADAHFLPNRSRFCSRDISSILGVSSVQVSLQPRPVKLSPQRKSFPVRLGASRDAIPGPTSEHRKRCLQQASQKCIQIVVFPSYNSQFIPMLHSIAKVQPENRRTRRFYRNAASRLMTNPGQPALEVPSSGNPGLGTTLRCPSLSFAVLRSLFFEVPAPPCRSFVVRAAAANVNPRTRLSHMTPFSGHDWCTRERCRLMMKIPRFSQNSRQMTPRILRRAREFPRIFRESRRLEHTTPHPHR